MTWQFSQASVCSAQPRKQFCGKVWRSCRDCPRPEKLLNQTCSDNSTTNDTRVAFIILATDHSMKGKTSPQQLGAVRPSCPAQDA